MATVVRETAGPEPAVPVPGPILQVDELQVIYRTNAGDVPAVDHVSFSLMPGQRLGLIGESGSGKTTMATALMRMTRPPGRIVGGRVLLGGRDLMKLDDSALRKIRLAEIAFVGGRPTFASCAVTRASSAFLELPDSWARMASII